MRKRITCMMLFVTLLCTSMVGCSGPDVEKSLRSETDKTLKGIQKFDSDVLESLQEDHSDQGTSFSSVQQNQEMLAYLKRAAGKMTYEIKDVDEEKLTVKVDCTYVDSIDLVQNLYSNMISWALVHMDNDEEASDAEVNDIVERALAEVTEEHTATEEITFEYKHNGNRYELKEIPENLYNVATAGVYGYFEDVSDSYDEDNYSEDKEYDQMSEYIETKAIKTASGPLLEVKNTGTLDVQVTLDLIFKDKNGKMVSENTEMIDCLMAGDTKTIGSSLFEENYSTIDIQATTGEAYHEYSYDYELEEDENADDILLKYTNIGDKEIVGIDSYVVFYKNGKEVGFSNSYDYSIAPGKYTCMTISKPFDFDKGENRKYDDYRVFTYAYQDMDR